MRPEMSEYFFGGRNDGGALIDESKRMRTFQYCWQSIVKKRNSHKTASEFKPYWFLSVVWICLSDFHMRFFGPGS